MIGARIRRIWAWLRQASGEDAYERHLAHRHAGDPHGKRMSRRQYFRQRQHEKWSGISRCC